MNTYNVVKKYIDEYDFEDLLAIGAPDDEYDSESREIADRISAEKTVDEIAAIISEVLQKSFTELIKLDVTKPENFMEIAYKIKSELEGFPYFSRVVLDDGTVGTVVDRLGNDYVLDIGQNSLEWDTIIIDIDRIKKRLDNETE